MWQRQVTQPCDSLWLGTCGAGHPALLPRAQGTLPCAFAAQPIRGAFLSLHVSVVFQPAMMRTTAAAVVVLASLLVAVVPAVHALGTGGAWNQIHHDPRNSGRVSWTSSFQDGACPAWTVYVPTSSPPCDVVCCPGTHVRLPRRANQVCQPDVRP